MKAVFGYLLIRDSITIAEVDSMSDFSRTLAIIACWLAMFLLHRQIRQYERADEGR
jgi:hypothetical protein